MADIHVTGISSPSGGGKTAVTKRVAELLPGAAAIFFDDYDFETVHPESLRKWLEDGANYNDWKTPKLAEDLRKLKAGQVIVSAADGREIRPQQHVIFDAPLGYAHAETAPLIDLMVFIDTPLDIAMARRMLRDSSSTSLDYPGSTIDSIRNQLTVYLDYGRWAYLEMDKQVKPLCDVILDGRSSLDELAEKIVELID